MDRGKNRNNQNKKRSKHSGTTSDEYDLERNFKQVNRNKTNGGRRSQGYTTESSYNSFCDERRSNMSDTEPLDANTYSGSFSLYAKLDSKLDDYSKTNNEAHNGLRVELEEKISDAREGLESKVTAIEQKFEKYLPMNWYGWTLAALGSMVALVYVLSYKDVVALPNEYNKIESRVEKVEEYVKKIDESMVSKNDTTSKNVEKKKVTQKNKK